MTDLPVQWQHLLPRGDIESDVVHNFSLTAILDKTHFIARKEIK